VEQAEDAGLKAPLTARVLHRTGARTGALAAALYGASKAGPAGAAAGLVAPELMATPSVQMGLARGLNWTGKGLQYTPLTVPLTVAGKGLTSLDRYELNRKEQERRGQ
jgi:hypothetical protein